MKSSIFHCNRYQRAIQELDLTKLIVLDNFEGLIFAYIVLYILFGKPYEFVEEKLPQTFDNIQGLQDEILYFFQMLINN